MSDTKPWQQNFFTCTVCQSLANSALEYLKDQKAAKAVSGALAMYCMVANDYGSETCSLTIKNYLWSYLGNAFYVTLTNSYICGHILKTCSYTTIRTVSAYATAKLADKPGAITNNDFITNIYNSITPGGGRATYKILHLSDLNVDYKYKVGYTADCGELICCQEKHGQTGSDLSGEYGHSNCDTPPDSVTEMLQRIKDQYTPDIVIVSGGLVSRDLTLTEEEAV